MAKKGRKGAKKQLTKEELAKIKELLDQEIKEVFGSDPIYLDNFYAINGEGVLGTEQPMMGGGAKNHDTDTD